MILEITNSEIANRLMTKGFLESENSLLYEKWERIDNLRQYYNCQEYEHIAAACTNKTKCGRCVKPHQSQDHSINKSEEMQCSILSWCDTSQVTSLVSYAIADRRQPLNPLRIWRWPHSFWFPHLSSCTPSQVTYIDNVSSLVPCHYERSNNRFNASTRRKPNLARCWNPFRSRRWYLFSRS